MSWFKNFHTSSNWKLPFFSCHVQILFIFMSHIKCHFVREALFSNTYLLPCHRKTHHSYHRCLFVCMFYSLFLTVWKEICLYLLSVHSLEHIRLWRNIWDKNKQMNYNSKKKKTWKVHSQIIENILNRNINQGLKKGVNPPKDGFVAVWLFAGLFSYIIILILRIFFLPKLWNLLTLLERAYMVHLNTSCTISYVVILCCCLYSFI